MKARKLVRHLGAVALVGGMIFSSMPAHASGSSPLITDKPNDVVDIIKHTQNSFRPSTSPFPSPWTAYQYACKADSLSPFTAAACDSTDLVQSQVTSNSTAQTLTFTMRTKSNIIPRGAAITSIPAPFAGVNYAVYFATTTQETPHAIGIECTDGADVETGTIRDDYTVGAGASRTGLELTYTPNSTCPGVTTPIAEAAGGPSNRTVPVLSRTDVMTTVHPKSDGWQAFVEVAMVQAANGAKRLDGQGNLVCAGGAPVCIDYDMSIGSYEGYSTVSTSNSMLDFDPATQAKMGFSFSGNLITMTIPWNPTSISGTDGDLMLDDARSFPWVLGRAGAQITQLTAEVTGLVGVGANTVTQISAVCPDSTDNMVPESAEPIRTVGATEGQVNRTIGNTTNQVSDTVNPDPEDNGFYIHGNGGTDNGDCIRGITGLLTLLDWTDLGFELRIYPRQPPYLPSASGVDCRYPIGRNALGGFGVANLTLGPVSAPTVDINTSPYDKPYTVKVFANGATPVNQAGPVIPDPIAEQNPLGGTMGKDKPCGYSLWLPGLHYLDIFADIPM
jgi:hypothetical protein